MLLASHIEYIYKVVFTLICSIKTLVTSCSHLHSLIEELIIQKESHANNFQRVKKKALLIYIYFVTLFYALVFIFQPYSFRNNSFCFLMLPFCQLLVLHFSSRNFVVLYFLIYIIFGVYSYNINEIEALKMIGITFVGHQQFFLFLEDHALKKILLTINFMVLMFLSANLCQYAHFSFQQEDSITNSRYLWMLLFFPNLVCFSCFIKQYKETSKITEEISTEPEKTNKLDQHKFSEVLNDLSFYEKENKTLKADVQTRELFFASFSHELRNSLNAIIGNIDLLKLEISNEKWLKQLDICKYCGEVMMEQINDVLDMTKINANKIEFNNTPENFLKVIEHIWNIAAIRIQQKNLRGELYITNNFPKYLEIDSHRLAQILLNLIGNSSKFTNKGFVKVIFSWHENKEMSTLKEPNEEFVRYVDNMLHKTAYHHSPQSLGSIFPEGEVSSPYDNSLFQYMKNSHSMNLQEDIEKRKFSPKLMSQMLVSNSIFVSSNNPKAISRMNTRYSSQSKVKGIIKIEVIDSGIGISPSNLQKLFQPFTQADVSIAHKFGGTGLGLYITKKIVEAMKGEIHVHSHQNIGSSFCILFPAQTTTEAKYLEKQFQSLQSIGKTRATEQLKCLIVSNDLQKDLKTPLNLLQNLGIETTTVNGTQEALALFKEKPNGFYSFIVIDINMSMTERLVLNKKLRSIEAQTNTSTEETPLLFILESTPIEAKNVFTDQNATFFLEKPIKLEEFQTMIQSLLSKQAINNQKLQNQAKILVVDDDTFNLSLIQEYLSKHNLRCTTCSNGYEAVEKTLNEEFDLILMDIEMPGMNGFETAKMIRARWPNNVIIGVTGHQREEVLDKAKLFGMNDIETKPLNLKKIIELVFRVLPEGRNSSLS